MNINLLNIVSKDNNITQEEVKLECSVVENKMGSFNVIEAKPFTLTIQHTKNNVIFIKGESNVTLEFPCDRCLCPVNECISIDIDKSIDLNELNKVEDDMHMIEEKNYIDGYNLDVDKLLYSEILIGWPMKILCYDTCKGVCNVCGQNLNEGTCSCEDTGIDPRMSVIRDVFKNFKEV